MMTNKGKNDEIAKDILNWLTDKGVDLAVFKTAGLVEGTKWTLPKLVKLIGLALRESGKLGKGTFIELKKFIDSRKKAHKIKDSEITVDEN